MRDRSFKPGDLIMGRFKEKDRIRYGLVLEFIGEFDKPIENQHHSAWIHKQRRARRTAFNAQGWHVDSKFPQTIAPGGPQEKYRVLVSGEVLEIFETDMAIIEQ